MRDENAKQDRSAKPGNKYNPVARFRYYAALESPPTINHTRYGKKPPETRQQRIKTWAEIAALIATVVGVPALVWQSCSAQKQAISADNQLAEMHIQNRVQFLATEQQWAAMHEQMTMDERAWVQPILETTYKRQEFPNWESNLFCKVTFKNTGRTPANNILAWAEWYQLELPKKETFFNLTNFPPLGGAIASGETMECETRGGLNN